VELNLPKVAAFLPCNGIQQDVFSKNYELRGVFQGFGPPGYPLAAEFMTFSRLFYEGKSEFQIDTSLFNEKGEKISDAMPRKLQFDNGLAIHDLITGWRVVFPGPGTYVFKVFCNNLNLSEYRIYCR